MSDVGNPRDHLANERTHLAWLRTSLTVNVLGLALARFGDDGSVSRGSLLAGGILVACGVGVLLYGSVRFGRTGRELSAGRFDTGRSTTGPIVAAVVLTVGVFAALGVLVVSGV